MNPKQKACRIIGVALAALPLAACLAVLFAPRPAPANLWRESAVGGNGVSAVGLSAPSYTATAGSGANGFAISTNGARIDFGAGASDYASSDGTTVTLAAPLTVSSGSVIANVAVVAGIGANATTYGQGAITVGGAGGTLTVKSAIADGASAVGVKSGNANTFSTAGAAIHRFCQDNPTTCATPVADIKQNGALYQTGVTQANLGTPSNGTIIYCSDCTIANPCAGGGTGAFAKRLAGAWVCN